MTKSLILLGLLSLYGCGETTTNNTTDTQPTNTIQADVQNITISGTENNYNFNVKINANETGCDQYTDWWEVLDTKGNLLYRRILIHSHPSEQPFTRGGGNIAIKKDATVYIRAHMHPLGYVGDVFSGSVDKGFHKSTNPPSFPTALEKSAPLPNGCAF